ncbi:MAG: DUF1565 domain-containing protein [Planctomycetes bacterium]|nr:DUF1565 domain-containing protein [Planctomycetota bacterium]
MRNHSITAALLLLASSVSWADEYHVAAGAANASDDNPGTADKPWRTLSKAASTARAGDVVLVHAGRYPETVAIRNSGLPWIMRQTVRYGCPPRKAWRRVSWASSSFGPLTGPPRADMTTALTRPSSHRKMPNRRRPLHQGRLPMPV